MKESLLFAKRALLPEGWVRDVSLSVDAAGDLCDLAVATAPAPGATHCEILLPGMPNLHSHAFQRAMSGLAERAGPSDDSFWTWREVMYGFVSQIKPEQLAAIACQLYVEMLKAGFTAVGEFHYLHHDPQGAPYGDLAEMSRSILSAAESSGIGVTLLPVLYGYGGFGGVAAGPGQRRFINTPERFLALLEAIRPEVAADPQRALGIAPHSLRAVTPETLQAALAGLDAVAPDAPVHIHIAEQQREVDDCLAWSGRRPVEWLLDQQAVGGRWCLVHATHMTPSETAALAASGAVVGLCPTTEANLGDGLFPAEAYLAAAGRIGIGSDSHISVSPIEELRWLEYGQRLVKQRRNVLAESAERPSVGSHLYDRALAGGAQALGRPVGRIAAGYRADLLVLDADSPILCGRSNDLLLDALVFAGNSNPIKDVMVGGRWLVRDGRHRAEEKILAGYRQALGELRD